MSNPAPTVEQEQPTEIVRLHTLAPIDDLKPEDANFKAYYNQLNSIFSDPTLHNIAVIGNRGSGKSSILRSYDRNRPDKVGDFLFISLIDFENQNQSSDKPAAASAEDAPGNAGDPKKNPAANKPEAGKAQKLEYSLLCQILARCTAGDLEGSSLSPIPTVPPSMAQLPRYLVFLFLISFPLIFHEPFGALLGVMGIPETGRVVLRGLVLALLCGTLCIGMSWLAEALLPRLRLQKFTLKGTHSQAELALDSGKHCLDQFKFELIYILSRMSDKIGCTVVFEDMERLDSGVCIELMTKLRELNTLLNTHRQTLDPALSQKPIRFIYAMSDEVFDAETRTKFFDYIMPVVPALNATNAEQILKNRLHDTKTKLDNDSMRALLPVIAPHLTDYRTLRSVLGEFEMLQHIYAASIDDLEEYTIVDKDNSRLLALAVYKVLFPKEYHSAFTDTGNAILPLPSTDQYKPSLAAMAKELFDGGYLDNTTLRMIGYSEAQIKDQWWDILMRGDFGAKSSLLFRFLHTASPDEKAFRDVVKAVVEKGNIFDFEDCIDIAEWIGFFYFQEPDVILEQFVACTPNDYSPHALINHLVCLNQFPDMQLARAAVKIGLKRISDSMVAYLGSLDLEANYTDNPFLAEEWSYGPHIKILCQLLGSRRELLPPELLSRKIGAKSLAEHIHNYHNRRRATKEPIHLAMEEKIMSSPNPPKDYMPLNSHASDFDILCLKEYDRILRQTDGSAP